MIHPLSRPVRKNMLKLWKWTLRMTATFLIAVGLLLLLVIGLKNAVWQLWRWLASSLLVDEQDVLHVCGHCTACLRLLYALFISEDNYKVSLTRFWRINRPRDALFRREFSWKFGIVDNVNTGESWSKSDSYKAPEEPKTWTRGGNSASSLTWAQP